MYLHHNFNEPIGLYPHQPIPKHITSLIFDFNSKGVCVMSIFNNLIHLTPRLRIVRFGCNYNQLIKLNSNIEVLIFGECFDQPIDLTKKISRLEFSNIGSFNQLILLPKNIMYLTLGWDYNQPIVFRETLVFLQMHCKYYTADNIPNGINNKKIWSCKNPSPLLYLTSTLPYNNPPRPTT